MRRGQELSDGEEQDYLDLGVTLSWLARFDLVVVDEGHYEPAPSWSRSVRALGCPTLLLSATPFRNDYKLFRVRGRFVFNLPFPAALDANIVRDVTFLPLAEGGRAAVPAAPVEADEDSEEAAEVTAEDRGAVAGFVAALAEVVPGLLEGIAIEHPKIIVRAGSFEILELLQSDLHAAFGEIPILIHDRVSKPKSDDERRRYQAVKIARDRHPQAQFWMHQTKLLEGIDEPTFVAVAIFDPFTNSRQLVQQIGRVLRSTDPARQAPQTAHVLIPQTAFDETLADWTRYLEFEIYAAEKGLGSIVPSEAYLPEQIVRHMPQMQYVDGRFRRRLSDDIALTAADIVAPKRAAVFAAGDAFDLETAKVEMLEAILARNRFVVRSIDNLPDNVAGWTFFTVDESPYLANHFITEWRLGVALAAQVGDHVYVFNSDGVAFSPGRVDLSRAREASLTRLMPDSSTITQVSAHSLDMSDRAIRSLTQRTRSFADTFTDLLDPVLRPTGVTGFVGGVGRYLGIARGKVVDAIDENVPIAEYLVWVDRLERELSNRALTPSRVFRRYAQPVLPDPELAGRPANILLDLTEEAMREYGLRGDAEGEQLPGGMLAYEDFCVDIEDGQFAIRGLDGVEVPCEIRYLPDSGRYRIISETLNQRHRPAATSRARRTVSLTEQINQAQSFRVLTAEPGVVYMYGDFLKAHDILGSDGSVLALESAQGVAPLRETETEKGETLFDADPAAWAATSVFGLTKTYCERGGQGGDNVYEQALRDFDLVLLDDDSTEVGDFIAVGDRRLAIIHAKAHRDLSEGAVTKLEAVGRQAVASLAFCATAAQVQGIADDRWLRPTIFNGRNVNLSRVFRNARGLADGEIAPFVRAALTNPSFNREVWVVAGTCWTSKVFERAPRQGTFQTACGSCSCSWKA